jgi:hypothetical protein
VNKKLMIECNDQSIGYIYIFVLDQKEAKVVKLLFAKLYGKKMWMRLLQLHIVVQVMNPNDVDVSLWPWKR